MHNRRAGDRRTSPSATVDVTRLEHENLYGEVAEILRTLRRMEGQLSEQRDRIQMMERDLEAFAVRQSKPA